MEYNQSDKQVLVAVFGEDLATKMSGALPDGDGEVSLGLTLGGKKIYSPDDVDRRINTAKDAGIEIGFKKVSKELGIELADGEKDAVIIAKKYSERRGAELEEKYKNAKPSEELERYMKKTLDLEASVDSLKQTNVDLTNNASEWEEKHKNLTVRIEEEKRGNRILSSLPKKLIIGKEDALMILSNSISFDKDDDGNEIIRDRNGKPYINKASEPETLENVINVIAEDKKWIGGNVPASNNPRRDGISGLTMDEAIQKVKTDGISPMSTEGAQKIAEYTKK